MFLKTIACCVLLAASAANAITVTGVASLHGFTFTLNDLDLTDGVTPSITAVGSPNTSTGTHVLQSLPYDVFDSDSGSGQAPWGTYTTTSSALGGLYVASAGATSDGTFAGTVMQASGSLTTPEIPAYDVTFQASTSTKGSSGSSVAFTLSPHTELVFTALLDATLLADLPQASSNVDFITVTATLGFQPLGTCYTLSKSVVEAGSGHITGSGGPSIPTPSQNVSNVLVTVTCQNTTANYVNQAFYANLDVTAEIVIRAVPEPSATYTMLGGLIGLIGLRRRSVRAGVALQPHRATHHALPRMRFERSYSPSAP